MEYFIDGLQKATLFEVVFRGRNRVPTGAKLKRLRWEKEAQRNGRVFALLGGNERYGACADAKQDKDWRLYRRSYHSQLPAVRAVSR